MVNVKELLKINCISITTKLSDFECPFPTLHILSSAEISALSEAKHRQLAICCIRNLASCLNCGNEARDSKHLPTKNARNQDTVHSASYKEMPREKQIKYSILFKENKITTNTPI